MAKQKEYLEAAWLYHWLFDYLLVPYEVMGLRHDLRCANEVDWTRL